MTSKTPNRDAASRRLSAFGRRHFNFIEFDEKEVLVLEIRKHPIGLVGVYSTGIFVAIIMVAVVIGLNHIFRSESFIELRALQPIIVGIGAIMAIIALVATAIGAYLYQSNVIFVTSEKIAQVLYKSIFNRKISQLSIGDVQDVTVSQRGILSHIFHYGTLVVETAGEQQNYTFNFVPMPYESARAIVGAHEENLKIYGN